MSFATADVLLTAVCGVAAEFVLLDLDTKAFPVLIFTSLTGRTRMLEVTGVLLVTTSGKMVFAFASCIRKRSVRRGSHKYVLLTSEQRMLVTSWPWAGRDGLC